MVEQMKAWVCTGYGGPDVLKLVTLPIPVPGDDQVLVRILATTVSSGDVRIRSLNLPRGFGWMARLMFGFRKPRKGILGTDFAGVIVAVGRDVTWFRPGDKVMGFPGSTLGCHAEYGVMPAHGRIALKPESLSFEDAASLLFGGTTALHFLRKARIKAGDAVAIIGASGAVGSAMVQLARHRGATVTAVTSTPNIAMVRALGAAHVIDYKHDDITAGKQAFDVIADCVGASSLAACLPVLRENGRYLAIAGDLLALLARPKGTKRSIGGPSDEKVEDVIALADLAQSGALQPVIDRSFAFADLPAAHAYVETGRKRGSVMIRMPV